MTDPRDVFVSRIELASTRVKAFSGFLFLCGGPQDLQLRPLRSVRHLIYNEITSGKNADLADRLRLAEDIQDWFRDGTYRDLVTFEEHLASLSSAILLVVESAGAPLLPIHECATAYRKGSSIKSNAAAHAGASYLLKLDFEGFFPSLDAGALSEHLARNVEQISQAEAQFVLGACLWRASTQEQLGLCIGAPSSPFLSNSIMYNFDTEVSRYCEWIGATYTRYSDDLSFSSRRKDVLSDVERYVRGLIRRVDYPRLRVNEAKRVAVSRGTSMVVTGLTLSNQGSVTVGRARKRGVRSGVNHFLQGRLSLEQVLRLRGELAFVLSIEPSFQQVLWDTYGPVVQELL